MAFNSWEEPARLLAAQVGDADPDLRALAALINVHVLDGSERLLVAAQVEDAVSAVTGNSPPRPCTARQAGFLASLGVKCAGDLTHRQADASIRAAIADERLRALRTLQPVRGDRLVRVGGHPAGYQGEIVEVSSIDRLGRIWGKRAGGRPILPQHLLRLE